MAAKSVSERLRSIELCLTRERVEMQKRIQLIEQAILGNGVDGIKQHIAELKRGHLEQEAAIKRIETFSRYNTWAMTFIKTSVGIGIGIFIKMYL